MHASEVRSARHTHIHTSPNNFSSSRSSSFSRQALLLALARCNHPSHPHPPSLPKEITLSETVFFFAAFISISVTCLSSVSAPPHATSPPLSSFDRSSSFTPASSVLPYRSDPILYPLLFLFACTSPAHHHSMNRPPPLLRSVDSVGTLLASIISHTTVVDQS